jgi:hypothetical protein
MGQLARNLTDPSDGFLRGMQYIILDRDPLYTAAFRRLLRDSGVTPVVLPAWSPNVNAFAERCVESAKSRAPHDAALAQCQVLGVVEAMLLARFRPRRDPRLGGGCERWELAVRRIDDDRRP